MWDLLVGGAVLVLAVMLFGLALLIYLGIRTLPGRIEHRVKALLAKEEGKAADTLKVEVANHVVPMVVAIRALHEAMTADYNAQIAASQNRTRLAEKRLAVGATYVSAAAAVVRELQTLRELGIEGEAPSQPQGLEDEDQRKTTEIPRPKPPFSGTKTLVGFAPFALPTSNDDRLLDDPDPTGVLLRPSPGITSSPRGALGAGELRRAGAKGGAEGRS